MEVKFNNKPPKWDAEGIEPSSDLQKNGFTAGYKPPAPYFNYLFHTYTQCIKEMQDILADGVGVDIPTMTLAEWEEWRNSEEYDPETFVAITDDVAQEVSDDVISETATYSSKKINSMVFGETTEITLLASGWVGDTAPYYYDFATTYPSDKYNIETIPLATYTEEQRNTIMAAHFVGADDNNLYVWGEKPNVDIPIKVKVVAK